MKFWRPFSTVVTIVALIGVVMKLSPIPFFDSNATTLVLPTRLSQEETAKALATVINPAAVLNTPQVHRFMFDDVTSVDWLPKVPDFHPMYDIVALKTITLGFFSTSTPMEEARKIESFLKPNYSVQVIEQPDPAFPSGSVVIVLSTAFECGPSLDSAYGFGILIRKHALRIGGPRPMHASSF